MKLKSKIAFIVAILIACIIFTETSLATDPVLVNGRDANFVQRPLRMNNTGTAQMVGILNVGQDGNVATPTFKIINPTGATISVIVTSSALPTGAATESTLTTIDSVLDTIDSVLDSIYTILADVYTAVSSSIRTEEIDPLDQKYVPVICHDYDPGDCGGDICAGTHHCYIDMHGYTGLACQMEWVAGSGGAAATVTALVTIQDDGTAAASCTYQDATYIMFGQNYATETDLLINPDADVSGLVHYVDMQVVIGSATDGATSLKLWCKKAALR